MLCSMTPWITLTIASVCLLTFAYWKQSRVGEFVFKPLASFGFVGTALAAGATSTSYGIWVLVALCFGLVGDVFLMGRSKRLFLGGLVAFLIGHLGYVVAFAVRGVDPFWLAVSGAVAVVAGVIVGRWLLPHTDTLRKPVVAYIVVIAAMICLAGGTAIAPFDWRIMCGACAFFASDISVARERFVAKGLINRLWGIPLYFGAQLILASSVV